jgi:hypothetical protein
MTLFKRVQTTNRNLKSAIILIINTLRQILSCIIFYLSACKVSNNHYICPTQLQEVAALQSALKHISSVTLSTLTEKE